MQIKKISILLVSAYLFLTSGISIAAQSVKYNFAVNFLAKTCEIVVPNSITFISGEGATSVSVNDIRNNKISELILIKLENCSDNSVKGSSVYISQGNTLTGTRDFFNNNISGSFGVQLTDGNSNTYKVNNSSAFKPSDDSIVWNDMSSPSSTKSLTANLRCQKEGCTPETGPFTATVVLSFFSD